MNYTLYRSRCSKTWNNKNNKFSSYLLTHSLINKFTQTLKLDDVVSKFGKLEQIINIYVITSAKIKNIYLLLAKIQEIDYLPDAT